MQDLFGQDVEVFRGQPTERISFSEKEIDTITEDVIYSGMLIEQMASNLKKVRAIKGTTNLTAVRRAAWVDLMWCFDLWDTPSKLPFDTACDLVSADSEQIRSAISVQFADEIRMMVTMIVSTYPDEASRLQARLRPYLFVDQLH
jgi:hypothetical protein